MEKSISLNSQIDAVASDLKSRLADMQSQLKAV
jgi:hypothetical protein